MSFFDQLVSQALQGQGELAPLRPAVEKELLHHDILREISAAGLLQNLTFIGGTCLRACYGSSRLSEDLDFTGGVDFKGENLNTLPGILQDRLRKKYGLQVEVAEPTGTDGNVSTWKIRVITRPQQRNHPVQRIHIDICAVPSHDRRPMVLRNHYGVEMGTSGLIIQAQSREEILADKMVALALRPNRFKNRDLWDIGWLKQRNIDLPLELVRKKITDRQRSLDDFLALLDERNHMLDGSPQVREDFIQEMRRFLPPEVISRTVANEEFWMYLVNLVHEESRSIIERLTDPEDRVEFEM